MSSGLELLIILGAVSIVFFIIAGIAICINKKNSKGRFRKLWYNKFFLFLGHCVRYLFIQLRLANYCVDSENYTPQVFYTLEGAFFYILKKLNQIKNSRRFLTSAWIYSHNIHLKNLKKLILSPALKNHVTNIASDSIGCPSNHIRWLAY